VLRLWPVMTIVRTIFELEGLSDDVEKCNEKWDMPVVQQR